MNAGEGGEKFSPADFVKKIYADLMADGWRMHEIDAIDAVWYFRVLAYVLKTNDLPRTKDGKVQKIKPAYIDQVLG